MKILIATGIYPPDIGGPAQYAAAVEKVWKSGGHRVDVRTFRFERRLPPGIRHLAYFLKCIPATARSDFIFALDTWSAALPAVLLARLLRKKIIIRTGGDFLWESYVERTGDLVLLREFYKTRIGKFSRKERFIFSATRWILRRANAIIFSTEWQRGIWSTPYALAHVKTAVVENYYGTHCNPAHSDVLENFRIRKVFVAGTRPLKWKNTETLQRAFARVKMRQPELSLDVGIAPHEAFLEKMKRSYAVILVSLGDISPNLILDAIRYNKPFIVTRETGLYERIQECALFVDPEDVDDIAAKVEWLADEKNYEAQCRKIAEFSFTHSWEDIGREILNVYESL